jgi:hypothetical protein
MAERHEPAKPTTATEKLARHPEATPTGGQIAPGPYQAVREFLDRHGCRWPKDGLIPIPDEDVEEQLALGNIKPYDGPIVGGAAVVPASGKIADARPKAS